jgi:signal transduction histidine kinase
MWAEYSLMLLWIVGLGTNSSCLLVLSSGVLILRLLSVGWQTRLLSDRVRSRRSSCWEARSFNPILRDLVVELRGLILRCEWIERSSDMDEQSRAREKSLDQALLDLQQFCGALEVAIVWLGCSGKVEWLSTRGEASRLRRVFKSRDLEGDPTRRLNSSESSLLRLYGFGCVKILRLSVGQSCVAFVGFEYQSVGINLLDFYRSGLVRPLENAFILKSRIGAYEDRIEETRELSNMRDLRFSHMSHDVRGPLNNVVNAARLIEATSCKDDLKRYVQIILSNSRRIGSLVEGFLDFSRSRAAEVEVNSEVICLHELQHEVEQMWGLEAQTKGLFLQFEQEGNSIEFLCDRTDMRRIVDNLVSNAIKYTEEGGVELAVRRTDGGQVAIIVRDTGPGMSSQQVELACKPYERLDNKGATGLGLGLAATEQMVQRNGGRLQFSSFVNFGTTVSVCLPAAPVKGTQSGKVLLVDDDADFLHVVEQGLSKKGWHVEFVSDFEQAEKSLASGGFVALLSDWQVGESNAEELLSKSTAVVNCGVISGHLEPPNSFKNRSQCFGGLQWFRKPVDLNDVHQWLQRCCEGSSS